MREITVGDCFYQIRNGANIKQGELEGGYPITRIETTANDVFNRDRMGYAGITDLTKYESYILEDGDLLMSHINSVQYLGRTVLYKNQGNEKIIHGMNLLALKAKRDIILPSFARYCFYSQSFKKQLSRITKKSVNQASFTVSDLKKITLSVPSLEEQETIITILDKCGNIINTRKAELCALDDLIKARFVEMFGDPVANSNRWEQASLQDVTTKIGSGATPRGGKESYQTEGITLIRSMNVHDGRFEYKDLAHITDEQAEQLNNVSVKENDVFINITGASVARSCIVPSDVLPARVNQHVAIIRCVPNHLNSVFANWLFLSDRFKRLLLDIGESGGATRQAITKQQLETLMVILPPLQLQERFVTFVSQVDKAKAAVQKALDETQLLFDSLMQQYFG